MDETGHERVLPVLGDKPSPLRQPRLRAGVMQSLHPTRPSERRKRPLKLACLLMVAGFAMIFRPKIKQKNRKKD